MKLTIEGTPEDIKKVLNTISGSAEHKVSSKKYIKVSNLYLRE